ncbi:MAG: glycosyl hydrolase 108 family protein [Pseudomonadota bacterium]
MAKSTLLVADNEQSLYRLETFRGEPFLPDETYISVAVRAVSLRRGRFNTAKYGPYIYSVVGQTNFDAQTKLAGVFAPATENQVFNQPMSRGAAPMGGASTTVGSQVASPVPEPDVAGAGGIPPGGMPSGGRGVGGGSPVPAPRTTDMIPESAPLPEMGYKRQDRVLVINKQLTPRLVYRGAGPFELGFGSVMQKDHFGDALALLEDTLKTPVTQFVSMTNPAIGGALHQTDISDTITRTFELINDRKGAVRQASLVTVLDDIFDNDQGQLASGFYALIADSDPGDEIDYDKARRTLTRKGKPYTGAPWLVFELRREVQRPDWGSVPDVNMAWRTLSEQVRDGGADAALNAFRTAVFLSPDLIAADAKRIYLAAKKKLAPLMTNQEFFHLPKLGGLTDALKPIVDEMIVSPIGAARDEYNRFKRCHDVMRVYEGGYVDHPDDPGGATNQGVTQRTYDTFRQKQGKPPQSVRNISEHEVEQIYFEGYWRAGHCHRMPDDASALTLFDACVNHGLRQAMRFIQRGAGLPPSGVDGYFGPTTLAAVERTDEGLLVDRALDARWAFYEKIMTRNRRLEAFRRGWKNRVDSMRKVTASWMTGQESIVTRLPQLSPDEIADPDLSGMVRLTVDGPGHSNAQTSAQAGQSTPTDETAGAPA